MRAPPGRSRVPAQCRGGMDLIRVHVEFFWGGGATSRAPKLLGATDEREEKKRILRRKLLAFFGKEEKNEGNLDFFFKKGKAGRFRERKENKGAF